MSATFHRFCYGILYMQACKSKECFVLCFYEYNVYVGYFHYSEFVAGLLEDFKVSSMVLESFELICHKTTPTRKFTMLLPGLANSFPIASSSKDFIINPKW
jgi:hypothetical protein